nr:D(2) dopamine receptor [Manis javanica]
MPIPCRTEAPAPQLLPVSATPSWPLGPPSRWPSAAGGGHCDRDHTLPLEQPTAQGVHERWQRPGPGALSQAAPQAACSSSAPSPRSGPRVPQAWPPSGPVAPYLGDLHRTIEDDLESQNWSQPFNGSGREPDRPPYNYFAMSLALLIFVIIFGNVLVCMAVSREKALQTTTNYLIVSLAVADLLVATLVMPWVVYLEVVGEWKFSRIHCDIFVTLDVMMCTASILNLCAISIDRYTAVAMPMLYNTRYSSRRRVTVMIAIVWVLSFTISCPLLFGLNNTGLKSGLALPRALPLQDAARRAQELEMEMLSSTSPPERTRYSPIPPSHHQLTLPDLSHQGPHSIPDSPAKPEKNGHAREHPRIAKFFEIQSMPNGKTRTSLKTISRRKLSQQKEKKATQMLAIVLGVFIICWLPFFVTHILNIHCDCNIPPVLYSAFTWLGYVNSAVNPIIYTTFNIEFRKAFLKILHC